MLNLPCFNSDFLSLVKKEAVGGAKIAAAYYRLVSQVRSTGRKAENPA